MVRHLTNRSNRSPVAHWGRPALRVSSRMPSAFLRKLSLHAGLPLPLALCGSLF